MTIGPAAQTMFTAFCLAALPVNTAHAGSGLPVYDEQFLAQRQISYAKGTRENYEEVLLPRLSQQEAAALSGVELDFPLQMEGRDPLGFGTDGTSIKLSVTSMVFLDEIATASAWLQLNGYSQQSLTNYALMLRYGRLGPEPPAPRKALCVPEDAETNPRVESLAGRLFSNMIVFILLHEIGHVVQGDTGSASADAAAQRERETKADAFAVKQMAAIGEAPLSMAAFFTFTAHYAKGPEDFASQQDYDAYAKDLTHPVDAKRLQSLASGIKENAKSFAATHAQGKLAFTAVALDVTMVAMTLADPGSRNLIGLIGRSATDANLAPTKFGATLGAPCEPQAPSGNGPFAGYFGGTFIGGTTDFEANAVLRQSGYRVKGVMSYGAGTVSLEGEVTGGELHYFWSLDRFKGLGVIKSDTNGAISGQWGYDGEEEGGGSFSLKRIVTQ